MQYKKIAGSNPFGVKPSFRDGLREREARQPGGPKPQLDLNSGLQYQHVYIVDHPALRNEKSRQRLDQHVETNETVFGRLNTPSDPTTVSWQLTIPVTGDSPLADTSLQAASTRELCTFTDSSFERIPSATQIDPFVH